MNQNSLFILTLGLLASISLFGAEESHNPLHQTIANGQVRQLRNLITTHPNYITEHGPDALSYAAKHSQWRAARVLVKAGVDLGDHGENVSAAILALTNTRQVLNYGTICPEKREQLAFWLMIADVLSPDNVEALNRRYGNTWKKLLQKRRNALDSWGVFPRDLLTLVLTFAGPIKTRGIRQQYSQDMPNNDILPALLHGDVDEDMYSDSEEEPASALPAFQREDLFSDDEEA